jgi:acetyl esterase/lipase
MSDRTPLQTPRPFLRIPLAAATLVLASCATHVGKPDGPAPPAARHEYTLRHAVTYTPPDWPQALQADVYVPTGAGPFPAVIVVHGGGWDRRDRSDMAGISRKLARRGYVAVNIDYRLAPAHLYPAQLDDTRAAIRWVRAQSSVLRVDPRRIAGWGYSAGGHLVALAGMAEGGADDALQAVVAGGTPSDLPHYPVSPIITKFIGAPFAQKRETWREASPVTHVDRGDPPVFQYHGTWDRLVYVDDAFTFKSALDAAGVPNELYLVRGAGHITLFLAGFGAEAAGIGFLDRTLRQR